MNIKKIAVVAIILIALGGAGYQFLGKKTAKAILSPEEATAKAGEFINSNLVQEGTVVEVKNIVEEDGLYKITVNVGGQDFDSYLTKDGTKFFPQVLDMGAKADDSTDTASGDETPVNVVKSDKPKVELFVMSYCPYGTQIEKGILPVIEALGDKIDYSLKFVDYAMHGEEELQENLRQYCIQKEQSDKLNNYLKYFLENSDSANALVKAGVDKGKLDACVSATDKEFKVTEKFNDKSTWSNGQYPTFDVDKQANEAYGVGGSPTLIVNGAQLSSERDSASLLTTVCSAFNSQPEECQASLSSATPAPGFGSGVSTDSNPDASCN